MVEKKKNEISTMKEYNKKTGGSTIYTDPDIQKLVDDCGMKAAARMVIKKKEGDE